MMITSAQVPVHGLSAAHAVDSSRPLGDAVTRLTDLIKSGSREYRHCLLLVDPALRALEVAPEALSSNTPTAIPVEHNAFPVDHRPLLFDLDLSTDHGMTLLTESVHQAYEDRDPDSVARGQGQRIGGWLFSNSPVEEVADYWRTHILQSDDRGQRRVLRFYDSRALSLMWPLLSEPQRRCLLGPVRAWYALDACCEVVCYQATAVAHRQLALSGEQWQAFHRHGFVNRALALRMKEMGRQPDAREVETAVASAARVDQRGLTDYQDQVSFVGHALNWHPEFDSYPGLKPVWDRVAEGMPFLAAISDMESWTIEDIRSGSWMATTRSGGF